MRYKIISTNFKAFWNNSDGWVGLNGADTFSEEERSILNLPCDGCWIPCEDIRVNSSAEAQEVLKGFPSEFPVLFEQFHGYTPSGFFLFITGIDENGDETVFDDIAEHYGMKCVPW